MVNTKPSRTALMLAWLAGILIAVLSLWGLLKHGFSLDVHQRIWRDIFDRPGGPEAFRFILQPAMAAIAALHDGVEDARLGRSPYLWTIFTNPAERAGRLHEGLVATARIILLGLGMDAIYQATVLNTFYPGEMALIALLLAFVPYLLLRGVFAGLARRRMARRSAGPAS
jgi:hypothetical protein